MIKRIRPATPPPVIDGGWLALGDDVAVELTSEDPEWPIEGALSAGTPPGWRAGAPGPQTIILEWSSPVAIRRILLVFEEVAQTRTQEFVLRASTHDGDRDVVRQQFTFSPPGTTLEREEYTTDLRGVKRLELMIVPAIDDHHAVATLKEWRVG